VRENRDKLDALAFELLRNEVLERRDIERIMGAGSTVGGTGLRVAAATDAPPVD
jgi:hypothetical protein